MSPPTGVGETPNGQHARLKTIEQRLINDGSVRIDALALQLRVSEMTIRRDLDELEGLGVARRVRGGAIAIGPEPFADRHRTNAKAKGIIADKLVTLLPNRGTLALDASTTIHRYATTVESARDLVVVTNGIDTFEALEDKAGFAVTLTGGVREQRTGSLVGPIAHKGIEHFLYDIFVCSAAGLDTELGSSEPSLDEAEVKRAMSRNSARIVLAVDGSKLGGRSQSRLFRPEEIDVLVTDLPADDPRLDPFRATITEII